MRKKEWLHRICTAVLCTGMMLAAACGEQGEGTPTLTPGVGSSEGDTGKEPDDGGQNDDKKDESRPEEGKNDNASGENTDEQKEAGVYFSAESGFYEDNVTLSMTCPAEGAVIYYTTDGSVPDTTSTQYQEPLSLKKVFAKNVHSNRKDYCVDPKYVPSKPVAKANIIRAVAYLPDGTVTSVKSGTYFVGMNKEALYGDAPVISLISDPKNLFDYETGIFVLGKTYDDWVKEDPNNAKEPVWRSKGNFSNKGRDWERPVSFEFIGADGTLAYASDMGLRMKGASTRTYLQKSMKLIAREEYGKKNVKFELIPGNERSDGTGEVEKYRTFVLRNGGNDCDYSKLRDPLFQQLASGLQMETQQYAPCVVFLDGEYWGLYTLVEDYSDNYIENNYGIDSKNVVMVKCAEIEEGKEEDFALFEEMYRFITGQDMSVAKNYEKACTMLDMTGFAQYCAFLLYTYNEDCLFDNNNWRFWRVREADEATAWSDGMWRIMLYDTEYAAGLYCGGTNFSTDNITRIFQREESTLAENLELYHPGELFRSLYQNKDFERAFILALCDIRNYSFEKQQALDAMEQIAVKYRKLAPDSLYRYGPEWAVAWGKPIDYYNMKLDELKVYLNGRYDAFMDIVQDVFRLGNPVSVAVTLPEEKGKIIINHIEIDESRIRSDVYSGLYFKEYELTVTAVAAEGYRFAGWRTEGCELSDEGSAQTSVKLTGDCMITAVFEAE